MLCLATLSSSSWMSLGFHSLPLFCSYQVVLEGLWEGGFMAIAAVGATNIGSIKVMQHNNRNLVCL